MGKRKREKRGNIPQTTVGEMLNAWKAGELRQPRLSALFRRNWWDAGPGARKQRVKRKPKTEKRA